MPQCIGETLRRRLTPQPPVPLRLPTVAPCPFFNGLLAPSLIAHPVRRLAVRNPEAQLDGRLVELLIHQAPGRQNR